MHYWTQPAWNTVTLALKCCVRCGEKAVNEYAVTHGMEPDRQTPWTPLCAACRPTAMIPDNYGKMHHASRA